MEIVMAKGQQKTNKESKKPKKSTPVDKTLGLGSVAEPVRASVMTSVALKGKAKNKPV
jgi:cobalamin biosynthesis protein CbiG|tara:strand:+ start:1994 stop:2167 length:174 start_codon:yes stop_codon:yes gene_type:complete